MPKIVCDDDDDDDASAGSLTTIAPQSTGVGGGDDGDLITLDGHNCPSLGGGGGDGQRIRCAFPNGFPYRIEFGSAG